VDPRSKSKPFGGGIEEQPKGASFFCRIKTYICEVLGVRWIQFSNKKSKKKLVSPKTMAQKETTKLLFFQNSFKSISISL